MTHQAPQQASETDSSELRRQYEVETEFADRLRSSEGDDRRRLYGELYQAFFEQFPHLKERDPQAQKAKIHRQFVRLDPFLGPDSVFMELGAGDGELAGRVAETVRKSYALEVTDEMVGACPHPANMEFKLFDGFQIPLPSDHVDIGYSNQVMEHLHPDDAMDQLREIHRVLKPGGAYVCITPNRLMGPHDISRHFGDLKPRGFHLREYTNWSLGKLMGRAGFARTKVLISAGGRGLRLPLLPVGCLEAALSVLPHRLARAICFRTPLGGLLGIKVIAFKGGVSDSEANSCDA